MGFFSSRKDDVHTSVTAAKSAGVENSVVRVIRSRFYTKAKGKEREETPASFVQGSSSAQVLSPPATTSHTQVSPIAVASNGTHRPRSHHDRSNPYSPSHSKRSSTTTTPMSPQPRPSDVLSTRSSRSTNISGLPPRKHTDTVTMTLAQRLNELAVANSEGLLNDDEYRLLRKDLFERFASSTVVPTEAPIVPVVRPPQEHGVRPEGNSSISSPRLTSHYQADAPRSPSQRSKSSIASGLTNLVRQTSSRRTPSQTKDASDTASVFSATSTISNVFKLPRTLSKRSSNSSIRSVVPTDVISISSRTGTGRNQPDNLSSSSLSASRTSLSKSRRRHATPPSAFPLRALGHENKYAGSINNIFNEENLQTVQSIRNEIASVEAEARRLMNAFSGLELSTLARRQRSEVLPVPATVRDADGIESTWTLIPNGQSQRRTNGTDSDVMSIRSRTSATTVPSLYSNRKVQLKPSASLLSRTGSLHRKNSTSSVSSSQARGTGVSNAPPVPPLSMGMTMARVGSSSSVSLSKSSGHLLLSAVAEDKEAIQEHATRSDGDGEFENELMDIQRRREEVSLRYEARLEYLRAKLKGAELHDKLLRK